MITTFANPISNTVCRQRIVIPLDSGALRISPGQYSCIVASWPAVADMARADSAGIDTPLTALTVRIAGWVRRQIKALTTPRMHGLRVITGRRRIGENATGAQPQ